MNQNKEMLATLVQVAHLYFEKDRSQQEIADQLGVSRSLIALYLKKAREQNIVRIEIVDPQDIRQDLTMRLQAASGVHQVTIVPSPNNAELTRRSLGNAVARFLETTLRDGDVLGFGWGRTVNEGVNLLAPSSPRQVEVVPLLGESAAASSYTQLNQITLQAAQSFGGQPYFLFAPLLVGSPELRDSLLDDDSLRPVTERWQRLNLACVGIGVLPPVPGQVIYVGEENAACFVEDGAVGDMLARYFNLQGEMVDEPINQRLIGLDLDSLRGVEHVVAVAGGLGKRRGVVGAIRTGLITDLFLDEELGQAVLRDLELESIV